MGVWVRPTALGIRQWQLIMAAYFFHFSDEMWFLIVAVCAVLWLQAWAQRGSLRKINDAHCKQPYCWMTIYYSASLKLNNFFISVQERPMNLS